MVARALRVDTLRSLASGLLAVVSLGLTGCSPVEPVDLALVGVTVVDPETGTQTPDSTVEIAGDRIVRIGARPSRAGRQASRVERHDGRFLIPGLWDLHVHALWDDEVAEDFLPRFTRHGVTGIRDLGGTFEVLARVRAEPKADWPRVFATGPVLDGPQPVDPAISISAGDPAEARAAVARLAEAGVDLVKVYTLLPREAFFAAVEAAKARDLPVVGHVPGDVSPLEGAVAGMASIEHLRDELGGLCAEVTEEDCSELVIRLSELGTHVTPTLAVLHAKSVRGYRPAEERSDLETVPSAVAEYWREMAASHDARPDTYFEERARLYEEREAMVRRLRDAGVQLLAGTDAGVAFLLPGESLARELAHLVEAGLTPLEALYAATLGATRFLGLPEVGAVREGWAADLVLLEEDPLADVRAVERIVAVVRGGRFFAQGEI